MGNINVDGEINFKSIGGGGKQFLIDLVYPVGSYFISDTLTTAQAVKQYFGNIGEWELKASNVVMPLGNSAPIITNKIPIKLGALNNEFPEATLTKRAYNSANGGNDIYIETSSNVTTTKNIIFGSDTGLNADLSKSANAIKGLYFFRRKS